MSEGLAQGPYVTAGVGFEPATFWTEGANLPLSHHAPQVIILKLLRLRTLIITYLAGITLHNLRLSLLTSSYFDHPISDPFPLSTLSFLVHFLLRNLAMPTSCLYMLHLLLPLPLFTARLIWVRCCRFARVYSSVKLDAQMHHGQNRGTEKT